MARGVIRYSDSPEAVMRKLVAAAKAGLEAAAETWHREMLPKHFTAAGGREYGYKPRKGDNEAPMLLTRNGRQIRNPHYSWVKRRVKGHNRPLVWSGHSEEMAENDFRINSSARPGQSISAVVTMNLPQYFYQRRIDHDAPDKPNELTRTTTDEERRLSQIASTVAQSVINGPPQIATVAA